LQSLFREAGRALCRQEQQVPKSTQHTGTAATEGHAVPGDRTIVVHGVGIDRFNDPSAGSPRFLQSETVS